MGTLTTYVPKEQIRLTDGIASDLTSNRLNGMYFIDSGRLEHKEDLGEIWTQNILDRN